MTGKDSNRCRKTQRLSARASGPARGRRMARGYRMGGPPEERKGSFLVAEAAGSPRGGCEIDWATTELS
jgi:hypothetical protein